MGTFLDKNDFELIKKYGGQSSYEYPDAHAQLRLVYDKLGKIIEGLNPLGYYTHIRRNPQNQGQTYEYYHWAQLNPNYSEDSKGKIFFVVDLTEEGVHVHIDSNTRQGYVQNDQAQTINELSYEGLSVDEACTMSLDQLITFVDESCKKHYFDFLKFGKEFNIPSCITLLNMEQYKSLLINNYNLILTGAPGTGKTYLAQKLAEQLIIGYPLENEESFRRRKSKNG